MGAIDDPDARSQALEIAGQLATLALERYHKRQLRQDERDDLLADLRELERKRTFVPTDEILGKDEPRSQELAKAPDESA